MNAMAGEISYCERFEVSSTYKDYEGGWLWLKAIKHWEKLMNI